MATKNKENKMANLKFKLTDETKIFLGTKLFRIEATASFGNVDKGDKGGFVEKRDNLSEDGNAWVYGDAEVSGNARVSGDARVYGNAWVYGNAFDTGYIFAYKRNGWNVTEVPTPNGEGVLLVKDHIPVEKEEKETIKIGNRTYDKQEVEKALKDVKSKD